MTASKWLTMALAIAVSLFIGWANGGVELAAKVILVMLGGFWLGLNWRDE